MQIIKQLRIKEGLSQTELAQEIQVSLGTIQNYEGGKVNIPSRSLKRLSKFFGVNEEFLMENKEVSTLKELDTALSSSITAYGDNSNNNATQINFDKVKSVKMSDPGGQDEKDRIISELRKENNRLKKQIDKLIERL